MEKPSKTPDGSSEKPKVRTWRPEEDRPSRFFQWMVILPDKFTSRKFNLYQLFLVVTLGVLFYVFVLERLGD
jgi:hypothetical protein